MTMLKNASMIARRQSSGSRRFHMLTAALSFAVTVSVLGVLGCGVTDPESGDPDHRLAFRSEGPPPCALKFNFTGGVAKGLNMHDFTPRIGEWNDVPIEGPGEIRVTPVSVPNDPRVDCWFSLLIKSEGHGLHPYTLIYGRGPDTQIVVPMSGIQDFLSAARPTARFEVVTHESLDR